MVLKMFEKNLRLASLLDFYGEVLSERKQEVLSLYYNEDLSLAEIAEEIGISRQGARDLIKKAEAKRAELAAQQSAKTACGYTVTGEGDPAIDALVMQRYEAKKAKNFAEADRIRDELKAQGIEIIDMKDGASWKRM